MSRKEKQRMEVHIVEKENQQGISVEIICEKKDERTERLAERIRTFLGKIGAYKNRNAITKTLVPLEQVAYIKTNDTYSMIVTYNESIYESPLRLFEIEEALQGTNFVRISRQVLANLEKVDELRPESNGKLSIRIGKTYLMVSRTYAKSIKEKLNIIG